MAVTKEKVAPLSVSLLAVLTLVSAGGIANTVNDVITEHKIAGGDYDQVKEYLLNKVDADKDFTLSEWKTLSKIYDYEIKKNGKAKLKDVKNKKEIKPKIKEFINK